MPSDDERFIELATRPFADNSELQLGMQTELRKCLGEGVTDKTRDLENAIELLERADNSPKRGRWKSWFYIAALLVSLVVLSRTAGQIVEVREAVSRVNSTASPAVDPEAFPDLAADQRLMLFGHAGAGNESERWNPLWQSERDNAAYLAEYAVSYVVDHRGQPLPEEIADAAAKVDPENGWFSALSAAAGSSEAVVRKERSKTDAANDIAGRVEVRDERLLGMALELIHEAVEKPRFEGYQEALLGKRIALLPPGEDYVSHVPLIVYVGSIKRRSDCFRTLSDVLAAGAGRCATNGDRDGFRRIVSDWQILVPKLSNEGASLVDVLVMESMAVSPLLNFRDAARSLGMEDEARQFQEAHEKARTWRVLRNERLEKMKSEESPFVMRGSMFVEKMAPLVHALPQSPPPVTDSDLKAGRLVDHSLLARIEAGLGWLVMASVIGAMVLARYFQGRGVRILSSRMGDLLSGRDWCLLFAAGVLFPVFWYVCFSRFAPFGPREWSFKVASAPAFGQFVSFLLSLLVLPAVIADSLLAKKASFGGPGVLRWLGFLVVFVALAGVLVFGVACGNESMDWSMVASYKFLIVVGALWICSMLFSSIFGSFRSRLRLGTVFLLILPTTVLSALIMALAVPFHHAEEKYWMRKNWLGEISADVPAMSGHHHAVMRALRNELQELMGNPL